MTRHVLVAGAGVLGAALAQRLARNGVEVTLVELHGVGDARAASNGSTRLLRVAHGEDEEAARSAGEASAGWRELERQLGRRLVVETGIAYVVAENDPWLAASARLLAELGLAFEVLGGTPVARGVPSPFPSLALEPGEVVALEPGAAVLHARRAVVALVEDAVAHGARLRAGRAEPVPGGALVAGEAVRADCTVWACGAWNAALFPELLEVELIEQDVFFFGVSAAWASPGVPAWMDVGAGVSGTADVAGMGFKVGADCPGPPADLDGRAAEHGVGSGYDRAQRALADAYLALRFPALAGAPMVRAERCHSAVVQRNELSAVASPGGIGIAPIATWPGVWILGDGTGHGFKHAPAIAAQVESLLVGS